MKQTSRYRWFVVGVFFSFMLLHQSDKLLIGPLTTPIMETFGINEARMGAVFTGALIVGAVLYPVWGYLYDRYTRPKLLALASFIWGCTTWLSALAPTFPTFVVTRASTGIDDSSYPGLYSMIGDYFPPQMRGRVIGTLQLAGPFGYMIGIVLAFALRDTLGWRGIFYLTGALGVVLAAVIYFTVRDVPRGHSEPELAGLTDIASHRFDWAVARGLLRKRTLLFMFGQGFFGVFPWNVLTYWGFRFLETERGLPGNQVMVTMVTVILTLASGYVIGGSLGDAAYRRTPRGRLLVCMGAVLIGAVLLWLTLNLPLDQPLLFQIMLAITAVFIPFAAPNVVSTVQDITLPEVRSTALSIQYFVESSGAALAPLIAGLIAASTNLKTAFLLICVAAWLVCGVLFAAAAYVVPRDIQQVHEQLRQRAAAEGGLAALAPVAD